MNSSTSSSNTTSFAAAGALRVLVVAGFLAVIHLFWLGAGHRAQLSESGAQTSLINAQETMRRSSDLDAVIVGSSQSARLSGDYLSEAGLEVGSLGMDGQGAGAGLRVLLERDAVPPVVLIEANTIHVLNPANEETVISSLGGPVSLASGRIPILRAEARLSSALYSWAKIRKDGAGTADSGFETLVAPSPQAGSVSTLTSLDDESRRAIERVGQQASDLLDGGHCVVLYWLPANGHEDPAATLGVNYLRSQHDLPLIDLRGLADTLTYSDGLHLDIPSARQSAHILVGSLRDSLPVICPS